MRHLIPCFDQTAIGAVYRMPGADPTSWGPMLKETYDAAFKNQLAEDQIAEKFMRSDIDQERWEGKKRVVAIKVGRNYASGSIGSGGALPQAGRGTWADFEITCRDTYTRVGFNRYVLEQTRNRKGAFAEVMATEMEGAYDDFLRHRNRQMWGTGSGILALVKGAQAAQTTIDVDSPGNIAGSVGGNRYIYGDSNSGMFVAFVNTAGVIQGTATVNAVSDDGDTITVDTPITCDDNAKIVCAQTPTQHSLNNEPEGLLAGADDGTFVSTYHGLSRTTYPILKSTVMSSVGALSLDVWQQGLDSQAIRTRKPTDFIFTELGVRRAYLSLLEMDRRYSGADLMSPDGGTNAAKTPLPKTGGRKAITYGDIPFIADPDAPFGMAIGVNKESWTRYVLKEGEWEDTGGVLKWIPGFDEWTAFYLAMDNFHCHFSNRQIRWEDIDTDEMFVRAA
jgi:hypothetical protein